MCFVMVVASTDSFKTFTSPRCLFFSKHYLIVLALSASGIAASSVIEEAGIAETGEAFSLIDFYSSKQSFLCKRLKLVVYTKAYKIGLRCLL